LFIVRSLQPEAIMRERDTRGGRVRDTGVLCGPATLGGRVAAAKEGVVTLRQGELAIPAKVPSDLLGQSAAFTGLLTDHHRESRYADLPKGRTTLQTCRLSRCPIWSPPSAADITLARQDV
jgi:hypothetical protein